MIEYQSESAYRILKNNRVVDEGHSKTYYDGDKLHILEQTPHKTRYTELNNDDLLGLFSYPSSTTSLNDRLIHDFNLNFGSNVNTHTLDGNDSYIVLTPREDERIRSSSSILNTPQPQQPQYLLKKNKTKKHITSRTPKTPKSRTHKSKTPKSRTHKTRTHKTRTHKSKTPKSKTPKSKTPKSKTRKQIKIRTPTPHPSKQTLPILQMNKDTDTDEFHIITPRNK
jgi:hypothetical protein